MTRRKLLCYDSCILCPALSWDRRLVRSIKCHNAQPTARGPYPARDAVLSGPSKLLPTVQEIGMLIKNNEKNEKREEKVSIPTLGRLSIFLRWISFCGILIFMLIFVLGGNTCLRTRDAAFHRGLVDCWLTSQK